MTLEIRRYEAQKPMFEVVEVRLDNLDEVQKWAGFLYYETRKEGGLTMVTFPLRGTERLTLRFYESSKDPLYIGRERHRNVSAFMEVYPGMLEGSYVELKEGDYEDSDYLDRSRNDIP